MEDLIENLNRAKERLMDSSNRHQEELRAILNIISGTVLEKYTFSSGKKHDRLFFITPDLGYFSWRVPDSNRKLREVAVSEILEISEGNRAFACRKSKIEMKSDPPEKCFSIHTEKKVINVVCHTEIQQQSWILGLNSLKRFWNEARAPEQEEFDSAFHRCVEKFLSSSKEKQGKKAKYRETIEKMDHENRVLQEKLKQSSNESVGEIPLPPPRNEYIKKLEEDVSNKNDSYMILEQEYEEFKKQIKESFSTELNEKMKKYKKSKEVMCQYANELKGEIQEYEKEVSLWQAVVYHFVLPSYQAKHPGGTSNMPEVLKFALDTVEKKFNVERVQHEFMTVLSKTRRGLT